MGASNYRKTLWLAWSACSVPHFKQNKTEYVPCCARAANTNTEPISPKLYLPQVLVVSVEQFLKVFIKILAMVFIDLVEDIKCWGALEMAGRCLGFIGQLVAEQAAYQNKGPASRRQKSWVLFLWIWW